MLLRRLHTGKGFSSPLRVQDASYEQHPLSAEAKWKIPLCLVLLILVLALVIGAVIGAIQFIRWRGIW